MPNDNTPQKHLVCVAWPYASGDRHLGHVAGAYLPPDIYARYQRLQGNEVRMVSGSDTHGTPVTVAAAREYGEHHYSVYGLIAGMMIMGISLVLFL